MKFIIAKYQPVSPTSVEGPIPFGIILLGDNKLYYKFDTTAARFRKIKQILNEADNDTFVNFAKNFELSYVTKGFTVTSDALGNKVTISITDPKFLDYLHQTFQNYYRYTKPSDVEGTPDQVLDILFKEKVLSA